VNFQITPKVLIGGNKKRLKKKDQKKNIGAAKGSKKEVLKGGNDLGRMGERGPKKGKKEPRKQWAYFFQSMKKRNGRPNLGK